MEDMNKALQDAHLAVSVVTLRRVFNTPIELLGDHEKREVLKNLGVDVDALSSIPSFGPSLIESRFTAVRDMYDKLDEAVENLRVDANLELVALEDDA
jgi:hypothetical protein